MKEDKTQTQNDQTSINDQTLGQDESIHEEKIVEESQIDGPSDKATYGIAIGRGSTILKVGEK